MFHTHFKLCNLRSIFPTSSFKVVFSDLDPNTLKAIPSAATPRQSAKVTNKFLQRFQIYLGKANIPKFPKHPDPSLSITI